MENKKISNLTILGAGPTGLGASFFLGKHKNITTTVIEKSDLAGGLAGSFEFSGIPVDYGSHRLHPACSPDILYRLKGLLGSDLLNRPRHGRIRLKGRWIHFPLKPLDLILRLPPAFAFGVLKDMLIGKRNTAETEETFESVLKNGLGTTIYNNFYLPYGQKIWGKRPEELSAVQAKRRVSSNSHGKIIRKILSAIPGVKKPPGSGRFYYPKGGFGQICESLYASAQKNGTTFELSSAIKSIEMDGQKICAVRYEKDGKSISLKPDYIWSTIPATRLVHLIKPSPPKSVLEAANTLEYRSIILIYVELDQSRFTEYDAHYFPESSVPFTRISEPKNYSDRKTPKNQTVLCAEMPCFKTDPEWTMDDDKLGNLVLQCLSQSGIPVKAAVNKVITKRFNHAYPIYRKGYEGYFNKIMNWLDTIENMVTFGRQGLFVHDNIHHALNMAVSAVCCIDEKGDFDRVRWNTQKKIFDTFVVED